MNLEKLYAFQRRMKKLEIDIDLMGNFPWIYLEKVNGNIVKETYHSARRFTVGFLPTKPGKEFNFLDIKKLFRVIRKYK